MVGIGNSQTGGRRTCERHLCLSHGTAQRFEISLQRPELRKAEDAQHDGSRGAGLDVMLMPDEQRVWIEREDVVVEVEDQDGAVRAGQDGCASGLTALTSAAPR